IDQASMPLERGPLLAARHFPQLDIAMLFWLQSGITTGRGQSLAIGTENHRADIAGMPLERGPLLGRRQLPELDVGRSIPGHAAPCSQGPAVRAERHAPELPRVPCQSALLLTCSNVPQLDGTVLPPCRGQSLAIPSECYGHHTSGVPFEG